MFCVKCGESISDDVKFCPNCGAKVAGDAETTAVASVEEVSPKSRLAALLLGIFLGGLGIHNFYLGRIGRAIGQLIMSIFGWAFYIVGFFSIINAGLTGAAYAYNYDYNTAVSAVAGSAGLMIFGLLLLMASGIWALVEWILIACGSARDKNGLIVKVWSR